VLLHLMNFSHVDPAKTFVSPGAKQGQPDALQRFIVGSVALGTHAEYSPLYAWEILQPLAPFRNILRPISASRLPRSTVTTAVQPGQFAFLLEASERFPATNWPGIGRAPRSSGQRRCTAGGKWRPHWMRRCCYHEARLRYSRTAYISAPWATDPRSS
jgi:hypothetical protein